MKKQRTLAIAGVLALVLVAGFATQTFSHCQIPCGIYDDETRFKELNEHITTIEKSMKLIEQLSMESPESNTNQIVRWVMNKDNHADEFTHIITYYFMAQRVKPADATDADAYKTYLKKLELLHQAVVYSMKSKQTTDLANVEKLKSIVAEFQKLYEMK